jgi:lauroyl/myristoyl acyltransferase
MKKRSHRIYAHDYIAWWGYVLLQFFFCAMPWRMAYFIAEIASRILYETAGINRKIIEGNLRTAFNLDEKEIKKYTRRIFKNFCLNTVDFLRFEKFDERMKDGFASL